MARRRTLPTSTLNVAMVAERWGTSDTFVYDLVRTGRLRSFRLGAKLIRIKLEDVEAFECRNPPGGLESSPENETTAAPTGPGASSGMMAMERTASRLERLIERQPRPRLVTSGGGERLPTPTPLAGS